jgi:isopenicillin-N N-acyltransferase like protein
LELSILSTNRGKIEIIGGKTRKENFMTRVLNLSGEAHSIGRQHGEQVSDQRDLILDAMRTRLEELRKNNFDFSRHLTEITQVWENFAPDTLEMLLGIAETLDLKWEDYFTYTISSYLTSCIKKNKKLEGCSTWAANSSVTRDGVPLIVKNRDYNPDHRPLQCLARVRPAHGNSFLCLTSAGSPGVFSSGVNDSGLAAVDTFISSTDIGPGIARYSLMMDILQHFSTVKEAVEYLPNRPHFGDGSVTVLDAQGDMAVFEIAHSVQAVRRSDCGFIASTNHFTMPETRPLWVDREPAHLVGNTQSRLKTIENALQSAKGKVDVSWAQALMGFHGDDLSDLCRHARLDPTAVTISCVILLPGKASMYVANGYPCQTPFEYFKVMES